MMASLYEPLFRHMLFPAYESGLRRRKTLAYLREYQRQQWLDPEQIDALQWRKLQALLRHCWDHVPYYRQTWSALGIASPEDIRDRAHFARLPVLDKPTIRANFDRLIAARDGRQTQEGEVRHARHGAHHPHQTGRDCQRLGRCKHLAADLLAHLFGARGTGHHDRGCGGQQQGRQLRHQTVTDGQQGIHLARFAERHAVLEHAHGHATDQVDEQNQQTDGITAYKFAGAVHRTVELSLLGDFLTARLGLVLVDQTGVKVSVDRHLLAGHGIEGETRAHLGDTPGTLGHHHEVDDHQNREHHDTDHVVAADHHLTECLNHLARGAVAFLTVKHHHPRRSHVERQTH